MKRGYFFGEAFSKRVLFRERFSQKGSLEFEKIVAIIIIVVLLVLLLAFAKTRFDEIKEVIMGLKVR